MILISERNHSDLAGDDSQLSISRVPALFIAEAGHDREATLYWK
jgi:hypothetical protein